jgi:hypothetical protein
MKNFLLEEGAAFYHVSPLQNLNSIHTKGLLGRGGKIFVSNEPLECILAAIAEEQIPEIRLSQGYVVVKLPQESNQFTTEEIYRDNQTNTEKAKVYQFVIMRKLIPPDRLSIIEVINFGDEGSLKLSRLAKPINDIGNENERYLKAAGLEAKEFPKLDIDPYWTGN